MHSDHDKPLAISFCIQSHVTAVVLRSESVNDVSVIYIILRMLIM